MSPSGEVVGLIPAAGYATRLQPLASSKEVLEIGGRPVMSFLIERMRIAGCSRIRVITRPEKSDVVDLARREETEVVLAHPTSVSESLLAGLEGVSDSAIVVVGFPDTIWEPADGFRELVDEVRAGAQIVLGLFEVDEPGRCDVVEVSREGQVLEIDIKPERPKTNITWGIAAARASSLRGLTDWDEPGGYFHALARTAVIRGVHLSGPYDDLGTPSSLTRLAAVRAYDVHGGSGADMEATR